MVSKSLTGFILGFLSCCMTHFLLPGSYITLLQTGYRRPIADKRVPSKYNLHVSTPMPSKTPVNKPSMVQPGHTVSTSNISTTPLHRPRVLCWVMTSPKSINERAIPTKKTWTRRCDKTLFFSSHDDPSFPCIGLNVAEGGDHLWEKTRGAFLYIYEHYRDQFDWFMKADDDTYVIVENLRHFLSSRSPDVPVYYGHQFRMHSGYHSGGPGYVLSRKALELFGAHADRCSMEAPFEDVEMARCLSKVGVGMENAADVDGLIKFFCFEPPLHITGVYPNWYPRTAVHGKQMGIGTFSRNAISFHRARTWSQYFYDYFVYRFSLRKEYSDNDTRKYVLRGNYWA